MSLPWNSWNRCQETDGTVGQRHTATALAVVLAAIGTSLSVGAQNPSVPRHCSAGRADAPADALLPCVDTGTCEIPWLSSWFDDRDQAIDVQADYYGDVFGKTRGGISTSDAIRCQGLLNIGVTIDFDAMQSRIPGRIYLLGQTTHGQGLTENIVGDSLVLSDIDSTRNTTQVGEYWWELPFFDENVIVRLGKQDVNTEFIYIDTAEHFVQSSFELTPSSTLPTFPQQSMAAIVLLQLDSSLQLKLGAWDALADQGNWGVSGNDTVFLAGEVEYKYALHDGRLPGIISISAGYQSRGEFKNQAVDAVHGYALQWEQQCFRESHRDAVGSQGLAAFAAWYPRFFGLRRLAESIGDSATAGMVYTGLFPCRDNDDTGIGVSWAELFQGGSHREIVCELFYRAELSPRVSLQPDFQYIVSPSGIHPDAFVAGVRFQLDL